LYFGRRRFLFTNVLNLFSGGKHFCSFLFGSLLFGVEGGGYMGFCFLRKKSNTNTYFIGGIFIYEITLIKFNKPLKKIIDKSRPSNLKSFLALFSRQYDLLSNVT
jgi:hypothetical protein